MIDFIKYSKIYFVIAILITLASIISLFYFGLNLGMDFKGGTSIKVEYEAKAPAIESVKNNLKVENYQIQNLGEKGFILKINTKDISASEFSAIVKDMELEGTKIIDSELETISPVVGAELKQKTIVVVVCALIAMLLYIAFAFRKVSKPVSSFQYGIVSTLMLFHDVLIPLGLLAFLGAYYGVQFTIPIVTAILAIIGYSINNNVVVFDRIRENLHLNRKIGYREVVNISLNQIYVRCIQTSLTTLFVLIALYFYFIGEEDIQFFSLAASVGIIAGAFSSIFLASPILAKWVERKEV
ncbi:MAG: protein translocase subunit SecF [Candidatus Pacebacteria bacterium]|nr:protein translocase subunit SecF [Candidatus Paceibacterota bacterium]